ncbi:MAG TPA: Gfo/Idh/MocA family oxidoreductase [Sedimentisphaerales bacterium]|nr:Gfo/Idh/MocA family oxidoreductase [Sedimentisphaerales bacterium]
MKDYMKSRTHESGKISRRCFLGGAVGTMGAFTIVPRYVLGGAGQTPPSEKLNIAFVGAGGRARDNIDALKSENTAALCDVDDKRAAETYRDYPQARRYRDFRRMLEKEKNIDAVVVSTPDHTHAVASMMAIKLGKHVYCEKPLAHSIYEVRKLTEAAKAAGVATQMGNQRHALEGIRLVCEWIWAGAIGPVREVHTWTDRPGGWWAQGVDRPEGTPPVPDTLAWDLWLGPAPERPYHPCYLPGKWRGWYDFGTGALGDMGCHILDSAFWALKLGSPRSIEAAGTPVSSETFPGASMITYDFDARGDMPPVRLVWYDGDLKPARPAELEPGRMMGSVDGGLIFVGDTGKILCDAYSESPRLIPESRMKEYGLPPSTIPRSPGHHAEWVAACKGGKPACSNFDYSGRLTEMVLLGNIAIRDQREIHWDAESMRVTNIPDANKYVRREYREGWIL